jgi:hypothetical protein
MSHARNKSDAAQLPEFFFDCLLIDRSQSFSVARFIVDQLVISGAAILHSKYVRSEGIPFASRAICKELIMTSSWVQLPLDDFDVSADPDDDLKMPPIDEWAGGVLPVRDADATGLRTAVTVASEMRRTHPGSRPPRVNIAQGTEVQPPPAAPTNTAPRTSRTPGNAGAAKPKAAPVTTEAETILKTFEEIRKRSTVSTKAVTIDAEFNMIQIQEPHGLPPSLIVPKISMKKVAGKVEKPLVSTARPVRPPIKKPDAPKKKAMGRLIEIDAPKFDTEIVDVTFADKIICAPGVTFRDGNAVKSRPPQNSANQLTRAQYEVYLEEMKRTADTS